MKPHQKRHTTRNLRQFARGSAPEAPGQGAGSGSEGTPAEEGVEWHRFECDGRGYAIYRRGQGLWRTSFQVAGVRYHRSLDTTARAVAVQRAVDWIIRPGREAGRGGRWGEAIGPKVLPVARPQAVLLPRLEEVFALYRQHATASKATVRQNIHAVELLLARFHEEPAGRLRLDVLTEGLPAKFQAAFVAERGEDREARARALRSSASLFNQAKSLFARALRPVYRDAGLVIPPSIEAFCRARVNKGRGQARQAASDSVVRATFERIHALKEADPEVFKAFWLVAGAGLRKGELGRLTWGQLRQVGGRWAVGGGIGKDGQPILVFLQDRAVKALGLGRKSQIGDGRSKIGGGRSGVEGKFVIEGSAHERGDQVPRRLNAFLRGCGWSNWKAMHDLRAWVGSKLFEADPGAAQVFLRHKDLTTTQRSYTHHARVKAVPSVI